ncbi:MAG: cryptochrome/photolyase family protein [Balneola sp.]
MKSVNLVFPHQLFEKSPLLDNGFSIYLIEEELFFNQYKFHKQKIAFHRATMKFYESWLEDQDKDVEYIEANDDKSDIRKLIAHLADEGIEKICLLNPTDNWLEKRIADSADEHQVEIEEYENQLFLNTRDDLQDWFGSKEKKFFQTSFYKDERKKRGILIEGDDNPVGGDWTYDKENRKKYPQKKTPPNIEFPEETNFYKEAREYVEKNFADNYGELVEIQLYPSDFEGSRKWLRQFFEQRFDEFGPYEDAIVSDKRILNHSVLTPMMNVGLLTPQFVVDEALKYAEENAIRINSLEGFIRQIIGWREFMRGLYEKRGTQERIENFWGFDRKIPDSFYDGTTGIEPVDDAIKKVLKTGYNHHIERLMILGNFMLLCEIDPDEVYQWFMEMYIDAYDWVMVPNVYGMSQFADGGLMATKPYISSSNYIKKMSDYGKADWNEIWDALFWRFMHVHRDFFEGNPRLNMLLSNLDKMDEETLQGRLDTAEEFLEKL